MINREAENVLERTPEIQRMWNVKTMRQGQLEPPQNHSENI